MGTNPLDQKLKEVYSNLSRWQKVQISRHPDRPHSIDYLKHITSYWFELHGDRNFSDDEAIMSGIAKIDDIKVVIIAQEKGRGTKNKMQRNFGMARPEGYRKALRLMKMAEKFHCPIVTLIDTPGAYPGKGAEERGIAEAIGEDRGFFDDKFARPMALLRGNYYPPRPGWGPLHRGDIQGGRGGGPHAPGPVPRPDAGPHRGPGDVHGQPQPAEGPREGAHGARHGANGGGRPRVAGISRILTGSCGILILTRVVV